MYVDHKGVDVGGGGVGVGVFFFFQAEDGIRGYDVTGVQTCALPISMAPLSIFVLFSVSRSSSLPFLRNDDSSAGA